MRSPTGSSLPRALCLLLAACTLQVASFAAESGLAIPELRFKVTFDDLTANAELSKGEPRPTLERELGLTAKTGFKKTALVLGDGEKCGYEVKGNLHLQAATVSMWVKSFNWKDTQGRFQRFFQVHGIENGQPFNLGVDSPPGPRAARVVISTGSRRLGNYTVYQVNGNADWDSGKWFKIDATWDAAHVAIYVNGRLGTKKDLGDVRFPLLPNSRFYLVPQVHFGDGRSHNRKDRSLIDEVEIWKGVLSADRILERYLAEAGAEMKPPRLTVPRAASKIDVDGRLEEEAWRRASRVPIPVNAATSFPHTEWATASVCYDTENLYVGLSSPTDGHLVAEVTGRDGPAWTDDAFEIFLIPEPDLTKRYFQWVVNSNAAVFDAGGGEKAWNGSAVFKSHVGPDSWTLEAAVPFEDLGTATPRAGDVWLANFCRDWHRPRPSPPVFTSWAYLNGGFLSRLDRCGRLVFGPAGSGTRVGISTSLGVGELDLSVDADSATTARVRVTSGDTPVLQRTLASAAAPRLREKLEGVKEGVLSCSVLDTAGRELWSYQMRFMAKEPIDVAYLPYPQEGTLGMELDFSGAEAGWQRAITDLDSRLRLELRGPGQERAEKEYALSALKHTIWIPCEFETGEYTLSFSVREPGRRQELKMVKNLEVPPLEWADNTIGLTDEVLEPWTPLGYEGRNAVSCWGRRYEFDGPFLARAVNQGADVLRGPIEMTLSAGGRSSQLRSTRSRRTTRRDYRAEFEGEAAFHLGELAVSWSTWMEYDGLTVAEVILEPPEGGVQIDSLSLKIPLRPGLARYIRGDTQMGGLKTGRVRWDGKRWETHFQPFVWACTEREGFLYFCESEANWVYPEEARQRVVLVQGGPEAHIELRLISRPVRAAGLFSYTFGFQATPVKPMRPDRRAWNFGGHRVTRHQTALSWHNVYGTQNGLWNAARPRIVKAYNEKLRKEGRKQFFYATTSCTPTANPTYNLYRQLWNSAYPASYGGGHRDTRMQPAWPKPYRLASVCPASPSFQNMMLYHARTFLLECDAPGLYSDTDGVWASENENHGCGFSDAFGKKGASYTILGKRRFAKRVAALVRTVGGGRRYWKTHSHAKLVPPVHCWADFWWPGEENTHKMFKNKWFYIDTLDDVAWRVEYHGASSGLVHEFLPEFVRGTKDKTDVAGPQPTESLLAMCAVCDVNTTGSYMNSPALGVYWDLRVRLGIVDAEFVGYWEERCPVEAQTERALASVYLGKKKIAIPVVNRLPGEKKVKVKIDLGALGIRSMPARGRDERAGDDIVVRDGAFEVKVGGRNYTFVSFAR